MLIDVHFLTEGRFSNQTEALEILAAGPCQAQLVFVYAWMASRYRLEFTREDKPVLRMQARNAKDLFDAVFLPEDERQRLLEEVKKERCFWYYGK